MVVIIYRFQHHKPLHYFYNYIRGFRTLLGGRHCYQPEQHMWFDPCTEGTVGLEYQKTNVKHCIIW
jgi:hypothetical protein